MNILVLPKFLKPKYKADKVRIGRNYDGGYVVSKKALKKTDALFSFGLYDDWSFEESFLKINKKANIYVYDGSIDFIFWIKYLLKNLIYFLKRDINLSVFIKNYLQFILFPFFIIKNKVFFFKKYISDSSDKNKNTTTVLEIILNKKNNNLFFKIDIEGNEYKILDDLIKIDNKIECLVIEFHNLDKNLNKIRNFINKTNLKLFHLHVNNYGKIYKRTLPSVVELSFAKKKYCSKNSLQNFPVKYLDFPNNRLFPDKKIIFKNEKTLHFSRKF